MARIRGVSALLRASSKSELWSVVEGRSESEQRWTTGRKGGASLSRGGRTRHGRRRPEMNLEVQWISISLSKKASCSAMERVAWWKEGIVFDGSGFGRGREVLHFEATISLSSLATPSRSWPTTTLATTNDDTDAISDSRVTTAIGFAVVVKFITWRLKMLLVA